MFCVVLSFYARCVLVLISSRGESDWTNELFQWSGRACVVSDINTAKHNNLIQDNSTVYNTCRNKFITKTSIVYFLRNTGHCYPPPAHVRPDFFFVEKIHNISTEFFSHIREPQICQQETLWIHSHTYVRREVGGGLRLLGKYTKKFLALPGMIKVWRKLSRDSGFNRARIRPFLPHSFSWPKI
jgi:hypothetical protein